MSAEATAAPAKQSPSFHGEIDARLEPSTRQRLKQLRWVSRLTSAWAPVTVFGIAFVIYLFIVELHTPSASWAQPALKGFGLLMLAWLAALIVVRTAHRRLSRARKLRHQTFEFLDEIAPVVDKHRNKIPGPAHGDVLNHSVALAQFATTDKLDALDQALRDATASADKHLATWRKQSGFDFAMGFVKAFAIAMIIRTILIEPFRIPSASMIPTLEVGDQIFVNKFIYGVRIPFMNKVPFVLVRKPERGDVIVFNNPVDESKDFIKRVIGIPGDTIEIHGGVIHLNGEPQPREKVADSYVFHQKDPFENWESMEVSLFRERLDGEAHLTAQRTSGPEHRREGPWTVPPDHVFVMGDNRENSLDSRYGLGSGGRRVVHVPYGHIKGKAMVIWLAWGYDGLLSNVFSGSGLKTERFFLPVR